MPPTAMNRSELPYETYERVTGKKWTSGQSADVKSLLTQYGIKAPAGSEQANTELQRALKKGLPSPKPVPKAPVAAKLLGGPDAKIGADPSKQPRMRAATLKESLTSAIEEGDLSAAGRVLQERLPNVPHLPLQTRTFISTLLGNRNPITEKDLYPDELAELRKVMDANPTGVRGNAKDATEIYQKAYGPKGAEITSRNPLAAALDPTMGIAFTMGRFRIDPVTGKAIDIYDYWNNARREKVLDYEQAFDEGGELGRLAQLLQVLGTTAHQKGASAAVNSIASELGNAYIGRRGGRPVEIQRPPRE